MRTLTINQVGGQWRYKIEDHRDGKVFLVVDWQCGTHDERTTIEQAQDRFGKCPEIRVD